ncbi:MAG: Imm27 family immunity protein [Phycisphaerales bacterium JB064]
MTDPKRIRPDESTIECDPLGPQPTAADLERAGSRLAYLVNECLVKVADYPPDWTTLYRDPEDGRYWELWYPFAEMQGGGLPALRCVAVAYARDRYQIE